ncbi:hypothetical protein ATN79_47670 [Paraburkholderia caribensis]|nr:hypothetical protein ATN79_47670 [Paraburkholderia caribensis]
MRLTLLDGSIDDATNLDYCARWRLRHRIVLVAGTQALFKLRSWRELHAELVPRVHVGANMYKQHLVAETAIKGQHEPL